MKYIAITLLGLGVLALAAVAGMRLSADAMTIIVGIVMGIGASIPTGLLVLFLLSRRQEAEPSEPAAPTPALPMTIYADKLMIVTPDAGYALDVPRLPATLAERHAMEVTHARNV